MTTQQEDFQRETRNITTVNGQVIEIPTKLTWGQELKAFKAIGRLLKDMPTLKDIDFTTFVSKDEDGKRNINISTILQVLPDLLDKGGEHLTAFAAAVLKKESKWIEENLDVQEVIKVIGPFFEICLNKLSRLVPDESPTSNTQENAQSPSQT